MHVHNMLLKVENETGLGRDPVSKAIINTDSTGYEQYMSQREKLLKEKEAVVNNTREINALKTEISDMKEMLKIILEKVNKDA